MIFGRMYQRVSTNAGPHEQLCVGQATCVFTDSRPSIVSDEW